MLTTPRNITGSVSDMDVGYLIDRLSCTQGVTGAALIPDDVWDRVCTEESQVKAAGGSMDVENIGLDECCQRELRICIMTDPNFEFDDDGYMSMLDEEDHILGHTIRLFQSEEYSTKPNIVFLSDDFILYTDVPVVGKQRFVMSSIPYRGEDDWIPGEASSILWFPCPTSSDILSEFMGGRSRDLATGILALNSF